MIFGGKVTAAVPKRLRHPYKLVEETLDTRLVCRVGQLPFLIELAGDLRKIEIAERHRKTKLTNHRNARFDHTRTAPWSG